MLTTIGKGGSNLHQFWKPDDLPSDADDHNDDDEMVQSDENAHGSDHDTDQSHLAMTI